MCWHIPVSNPEGLGLNVGRKGPGAILYPELDSESRVRAAGDSVQTGTTQQKMPELAPPSSLLLGIGPAVQQFEKAGL